MVRLVLLLPGSRFKPWLGDPTSQAKKKKIICYINILLGLLLACNFAWSSDYFPRINF